jgi:hypothetical protein
MTTSTSTGFETVTLSASNEDRLSAAAQHVHAAEAFLHTARQSGVDEWVSVAYQHLHDALTEHTTCLRECSSTRFVPTPSEENPMNRVSDHGADIHELSSSFPRVPARIVSAVFEAYVPVTRSKLEALQATRERLSDALAA